VATRTQPRPANEISPSAAKLRLLKRLRCTLKFEKLAWASGATLVAGVDEVGRGSLFGPVVAAAVVLDSSYRIRGLRDSKLLPAERREVLAERIREHAMLLIVRPVLEWLVMHGVLIMMVMVIVFRWVQLRVIKKWVGAL